MSEDVEARLDAVELWLYHQTYSKNRDLFREILTTRLDVPTPQPRSAIALKFGISREMVRQREASLARALKYAH